MISRIKRLLRDIYYYARRHPVKVFLLVIMPLLTGGILQKLLATVGLRLPGGLMGDSHNYSAGRRGGFNSLGGAGNGALGESVNGLMALAKMFM
jgi:hypothetical protein